MSLSSEWEILLQVYFIYKPKVVQRSSDEASQSVSNEGIFFLSLEYFFSASLW
jgi:hypothetical protein